MIYEFVRGINARFPLTKCLAHYDALEAMLCFCCVYLHFDRPYCEAIVPLPTAIDSGVAMMPNGEFDEPAVGAVSYTGQWENHEGKSKTIARNTKYKINSMTYNG